MPIHILKLLTNFTLKRFYFHLLFNHKSILIVDSCTKLVCFWDVRLTCAWRTLCFCAKFVQKSRNLSRTNGQKWTLEIVVFVFIVFIKLSRQSLSSYFYCLYDNVATGPCLVKVIRWNGFVHSNKFLHQVRQTPHHYPQIEWRRIWYKLELRMKNHY